MWDVIQASCPSSEGRSSKTALPESRRADIREMASGIIISSLRDAPLRFVFEAEDDPCRMINLLDSRYASRWTVSRIAVQSQLFGMSYKDQNMYSYVDQYASLFGWLERM